MCDRCTLAVERNRKRPQNVKAAHWQAYGAPMQRWPSGVKKLPQSFTAPAHLCTEHLEQLRHWWPTVAQLFEPIEGGRE